MGEVPPELDTSLADSLLEHLTEGRVKEALEVTRDNRFHACLKSNCSDTITVVAGFLKTSTFRDNPQLYDACEEILKTTTSVATPQEVLLELMALLESCEDDNFFRSILKALQMCLLRLPENKILSIDHALEAVLEYVEKLPYADVDGSSYTEEKQKLLENGSNITRLLTNYVTLTLFLQPIREEFLKDPSLRGFHSKTRRSVLVKFLMKLLDGSFARLHLKVEDKPVNTYTRQCSEFLVQSISALLGGDPFCILRDIEERFRWPGREPKNANIFTSQETVSNTSLTVFFYVIFVGKQIPLQIPRIYSSIYVCEVLLYLITASLENDLEEVQMKSVELLRAAIDDLAPNTLQSNHLELQIHANLCLNLTNLMIYCNSEEIRKTSIETFGCYIRKFDDEGRFLVIEKLFEKYKSDASNFRGFLTTTFKDFVAEILARGENRFPVQQQFFRILNTLTTLKDKEATDLVQEAEVIISTLNTIRFLALRDVDNRTDFWKLVPCLESEYLHFVRKSLDLGRAHYEAEKVRIENGQDEDISTKIQATVNEQMLPKLTREQKLHVMSNSLMKLDLIESVLARVNECLKNVPKNCNFLSRRIVTFCAESSHTSARKLQIPQRQVITTSRNFSSQNTTKTPVESINDFRAREEAREAQFEDDHRAEEKATTTEPVDEEQDKVSRVQEDILRAALQFAPSIGWTREAITKGAESIGYPGVVHGMFPDGGVELIQYFYTDCNAQLVQWLKKETDGVEKVPNPTKFICRAIETRLRMLQPYLSTWPQAIGILSLPQNAPNALTNLLTLADDICYYSGDRAVNITWYTRRVGVAGIIKITELYMLQDKSIDHQDTWKFLERRMDDAVFLHSFFTQSDEAKNHMQKAITSAFETGKNILGLNYRR